MRDTMNIKFLIERMSEENVKKLESYCVKYPNSGGWLMNELANHYYWTNLTYESIATLNDVLDCGWRPNDIANIFSRK
jgi:hypothetical protein